MIIKVYKLSINAIFQTLEKHSGEIKVIIFLLDKVIAFVSYEYIVKLINLSIKILI